MLVKEIAIFCMADRSQAWGMLSYEELCHFVVGPGPDCGKLANNFVIFRQIISLGR